MSVIMHFSRRCGTDEIRFLTFIIKVSDPMPHMSIKEDPGDDDDLDED